MATKNQIVGHSGDNLSAVLKDFARLTNNPVDFLSQKSETSSGFRKVAKCIFDLVHTRDDLPHSSDLEELLAGDSFDDEQVWIQLETDNRLSVDSVLKNAASLLVEPDQEFFGVAESEIHQTDVRDEEEEKESGIESDEEEPANLFGNLRSETDEEREDDAEEDEDRDLADEDNERVEGFMEPGTDDDEDEEPENAVKSNLSHRPYSGPKSVVDDQFFRLGEMHECLLENERHEDMPDDGIDYFAADDDDEESDREDFKYTEFFDPPPDDAAGEQGKEKAGVKSTFEKRQEKLKANIKSMEEEAVSERPWQLTGEISAGKRPENSLLEEFLQFDHVTRQAPVITEEVTQSLEGLILQRVKDKAFDDVQRKVKPKDVDPYEYKKKLILDDSKPKMSLSQTYEQEYLKKTATTEQVEKEEHRKIRKAMNELFVKLDALSNFHFVPKPVAPDIKIINNLPTIVVEEVQPSVVSSGQLLAPEEVQAKRKSELKGTTEATSTDKKRARRKKKMVQKLKAGRQKKRDADQVVEKKKEKQAGKSGGSSTAFFSKLQDTVKTDMQTRRDDKVKKRKNDAKNKTAGKRIKL